jgi:hypothetical protein
MKAYSDIENVNVKIKVLLRFWVGLYSQKHTNN